MNAAERIVAGLHNGDLPPENVENFVLSERHLRTLGGRVMFIRTEADDYDEPWDMPDYPEGWFRAAAVAAARERGVDFNGWMIELSDLDVRDLIADHGPYGSLSECYRTMQEVFR